MNKRALCVWLISGVIAAVQLQAQNDTVLDSDGVTTNFGGADLHIGANGTNNLLLIRNGGVVTNVALGAMGANSGGSHNIVIVTNTSSALFTSGELRVGASGSSNTLTIADGGLVVNQGTVFVGRNTGALANEAMVTGSGSTWQTFSDFAVGNNGSDHRLTVAHGGQVVVTNGLFYAGVDGHNSRVAITGGGQVLGANGYIGFRSGVTNNVVVLTDTGSMWQLSGGLVVGGNSGPASYNQLIVSNGAQFVMGGAGGANLLVGQNAGSSNNALAVTGPGSLAQIGLSGNFFVVGNNGPDNSVTVANSGQMVVSNGTFIVGGSGVRASLTITNGGQVTHRTAGLIVGYNSGSTNNQVVVRGANSLLQLNGTLQVGRVAGADGSVLIEDGATLEAPTLETHSASAANTISNRGGVYQFNTISPTVTPGTAGSVMLSNGTVSFRGVTAAPTTPIAGLTYQGNNAFRLNNASNATGLASYTFDTGLGATNYTRLVLQNNSRWRSTTLTVGSGGSLIGNGTVESVSVTNMGTIAPGFSAGLLTLTSNLVLGSSSRLEMEIGGTNALDYDRLVVGGSVTVTGTLAITSINAFSTTPGDTFALIDNQGTGPIFGWFDGLTNNAFIDASANGGSAFFRIQYDGGTGNDLVLIATIPEPSALLLLMVTCGLLAWRRTVRS